MSTIDDISRAAEKEAKAFMSGKPIWVYWIVYTVLIGVIFAVAYMVIYTLALRWWVLALVIIVAGMCVGTYIFFKKKHEVVAKE